MMKPNDINRHTDIRVAAYSAFNSDDAVTNKLKIDAFIKGASWADKHPRNEHVELSTLVKRLSKEYKRYSQMCSEFTPVDKLHVQQNKVNIELTNLMNYIEK